MFTKLFAVTTAAVLTTSAFAGPIHDEIHRIASDIRNEVYSSAADTTTLQQARADLLAALSAVRNRGNGAGDMGIYCQRVQDTSFYAPTRLADKEWLQDYGTDLTRCQSQLRSARNGLICIRNRDTDWYAPMLASNKVWRAENATDYNTCERQVAGSRHEMFCQRIRDTSFYALARISTGEWLQNNGTSLEECLRASGSFTDAGKNLQIFKDVSIPGER